MTRPPHRSVGVAARIGLALVLAGGCALHYVVPQEDACGPTTTACDGACVDIDIDPDHCGACSNFCDDDDVCTDGGCITPEPCELDACETECVDTQNDPANCGGCGTRCDSSAECLAGECVVTCGDSCDSDAELCVDGTCTCRSGLIRCDDDCVDLASDDDNCGMCDRECEDMLCLAGECTNDCGALELCDEACVDLATHPLNCGACERDCHPSQVCVAGECKTP